MRHMVRGNDAVDDIMREAADEIERLRGLTSEPPPVAPMGREDCAALIDTMLTESPWKDQMWSRGALMIAARAIRRGRHLTDAEKIANAFRWIEDGDEVKSEGESR
jgi:hypothetical protein